jgi:flagellar protein FlaG
MTMGIESLSGASAAPAYQSTVSAKSPVHQAEKGVKPDVPVAEKEVVVVVASQPIAAQVAEGEKQSDEIDLEALRQKKQNNETAMKNAVKDINKILNNNTKAEFGYHEGTRRITIKIRDKATDEVIREIPSEKALELLAKAWEIAGILVDEKR